MNFHKCNTVVFLIWTGTSFLCHFCAKAFLASRSGLSGGLDMGDNVLSVALLTLVQIATCCLAVDVNCRGNDFWLMAVRVTHLLATFTTNLGLAVMFASSTLAIKLMEPITSAVTVYCVQGTALSSVTILSLPIIVGGAIAFSGNPFSETQVSVGVCSVFVSNILLAFRNLAIKKMDSANSTTVTLKHGLCHVPLITCCMLAGWLSSLVLETSGFLKVGVSYTAAMCLLSGVFHVAYSYVSTGLILSELSLVGHAVANIMKRVLVVLLLYIFGKRTAGPYNLLGLGACTLGLFLYAWDKQRKPPTRQENVADNSCNYRPMHRSSLMVTLGSTIAFALCAFYALSGVSVSFKRSDVVSFHQWRISNVTPIAREGSVFPTDPFIGLTFGRKSLQRPEVNQLNPDLLGYLSNNTAQVNDFLGRRLIKKPEESGYLSTKLKTSLEVIKETQRIHYNVFTDAIGKFKYCMLFDIADSENKGDPAITVGEILLIARMSIDIIYYCETLSCTSNNINKALLKAQSYSSKELVILLHGGGNIHGYRQHDFIRFKIFKKFQGYQLFVFPQSIWVSNTNSSHFQLISSIYCCNDNLTIVLRDKNSYWLARQHFNGSSRLLMAPDIAFQIGPVNRFVSPVFDILWVRRSDDETPGYSEIPDHPSHLRVHVSDWLKFSTPKANISMETAAYATVMGLFFLQRGRVVVTDRLHGHILATLLNIPHVLLDNPAKKLSSYHNTWTSGLENTRLTSSPVEAMKLALELLDNHANDIPPRQPWLNVSEYFHLINYSIPETGYP